MYHLKCASIFSDYLTNYLKPATANCSASFLWTLVSIS